MTRRVLRFIHRWLGLVLLLPLLMQGLTGTFLALTPAWEAVRPEPAIGRGPARPASAIIAAAAMPGLVAVRYHPSLSQAPAVVELAPPNARGSQLQVMVDPASLAVLGTRQTSATYRWVHLLHEHLLMPAEGGRSVIGWFGAGLLLLGLSGLVLWWPSPGRWRAAVTVGRGLRGARLQRELHGAAGFWISAMLVVMSASGMAQAFPQTARALFGVTDAGPPRGVAGTALNVAGTALNVAGTALDIDAVLARAATAVPGATAVDVRLLPGRPVMVRLQPEDAMEGAPPLVAMVDPAGRRVVSLQDPRTQDAGAATLGWLRQLHFGEAFGAPWRMLVVLTGLVLPLMAVTGGTLWLLKRRNRGRLSAQRNAAMPGIAE